MANPLPTRRCVSREPITPLESARAKCQLDAVLAQLDRQIQASEKPRKHHSTKRLNKPLTTPSMCQPTCQPDKLSERLDRTFQALSDPTRRAMLATLARGECTVGRLAEPHAISLAAACKHIATLERAGLITRRKQGRAYLLCLSRDPMAEAQTWLRQWETPWTSHRHEQEQRGGP